MDKSLIAELRRIFDAITIPSPTFFSFAGRFVPQPDPAMQSQQGFYSQQTPLVSALQQQLYQYCFIQKFKGELRDESPIANTSEDNLMQALSEANASRERWDSGWQIYQILPSGQILAQKHGFTRMLWPGEFVTHEGPGVAPRVGTNISVFFAKESLTMQPGFYFAFGETVVDQQDDYNLVRFYWNIEATGVSSLLRLITQNLNRFQVPFRLKCLSNRRHYSRLDAMVLFVNKRFYRITAELVLEVHRRIIENLESETPLFTKQLAPGLGLAEDPGNGDSFGMSRCRMLAEAIWSAYLQGLQTEQARLHEMVKLFEHYGIAFERPYLNAGSIDQYEFPNYQS